MVGCLACRRIRVFAATATRNLLAYSELQSFIREMNARDTACWTQHGLGLSDVVSASIYDREKLSGHVASVTGPQDNEELGRRREGLVGSVPG